MHKGQSGFEFVTLMGVSVAFLIGVLAVIGQVTSEQQHENTFREVQDLSRSIQNELLLASEVEPGYVRTIRIPNLVNNREYDFSVEKRVNVSASLEFEYEDRLVIYLVPYFEGDLSKGDNVISKGEDGIRVR